MSRTYKDTKVYRERMCEKVQAWPCGGPPSEFKKTRRRVRRTRERQALRENRDAPLFRKTDCYDYF